MKTCVAIAFAALVSSVAVSAQDRIVTNPKPDSELKQLFPNAATFSPLTGTPLHFTAYASDPTKAPNQLPLGYAFWTTDMVPNERGYHGAVHMLVGLTLNGIITGVVVDYTSEPFGYFSVEPKEFAAQFTNKSIRDPFRPGVDVDLVSRATLTINSATRAIRDGTRMVARALLSPEAIKASPEAVKK